MNRPFSFFLVLAACSLFLTCQGTPTEPVDPTPDPSPSPEIALPLPPGFSLRLEAEAGSLYGTRIASDRGGFTGSGYVTGFEADGASVVIHADIPSSSLYRLTLRSAVTTEWGAKTNDILIDGSPIGQFETADAGVFQDSVLSRVFIRAGAREITVRKNWGYFDLDAVILSEPELPGGGSPLSAVPVNPDADEGARRLKKFLADNYGSAILSGQQDLTWFDGIDMAARVEQLTGRRPALMGYDFLNAFGTSGSGLRQVEEAIAHWEAGGVVSFCWHWRAGAENEFYTDRTSFRIDMDPASQAYAEILADIDGIAAKLALLRDAGVPVLWRPLHEASGGWFWWGASGPEACAALWRLMYQRMTVMHGLTNLLWVWNGQAADWYPGDAYVDFIGEDVYDGDRNYSSRAGRYDAAVAFADAPGSRMAAITENGAMPDPDNLVRDGVAWSWFMTWNDGNGASPESNFIWGEKYTEHSMKRNIYNHWYVLTLDELPDLEAYPLD